MKGKIKRFSIVLLILIKINEWHTTHSGKFWVRWIHCTSCNDFRIIFRHLKLKNI